MNKPATLQLRLPRSLKDGVQRLAKREGISMNQFMAMAIAEKLSVLETVSFFEERAKRANFALFDEFMSRERGEPPRPGDELPEGYVSPLKRKG
jgi:uncharacterized protein (DUF1778 family)